MSEETKLLAAQSAYFGATGIWPLLHLNSFEAVTGPKVDRWLVKTVGATVAAIGASLAVASRQDRASTETVVLATGSAAALGAIDVVYAVKGRISPVYLIDAGIQALILLAWRRARSGHAPSAFRGGHAG
jgi:hypothetical protein